MTRDATKTAPSVQRATASILIDPDTASTKRIAWAFGCAKKGSDEELALFRILRERFDKLGIERAVLT